MVYISELARNENWCCVWEFVFEGLERWFDEYPPKDLRRLGMILRMIPQFHLRNENLGIGRFVWGMVVESSERKLKIVLRTFEEWNTTHITQRKTHSSCRSI